MTDIIFISSRGCPQCRAMRQSINSMSSYLNLNITLKEYDCETDEAIEAALDYKINDIPGCNIGGRVIQGEKYNPDEILKALKQMT